MFISTVFYFFYIIVINFIVRLSKRYDCLLIFIDKFTRQMFLISNYITNFAAIWVKRVFKWLQIADWNISCVIIFDRNFKFILTFWNEMLKQLNVALLFNIVYHSQIDDLIERFNEMIEIIIKYFIISNFNLLWW